MSVRLPRVRKEQLLVHALQDEIIVYDMDRHKAHCLNPTAALVWRQCDGQATCEETIRLLERKVEGAKGEELLWRALEQLQKARLLAEPAAFPEAVGGMTRRTAMRAIGLTAALGLPLVSSIVAPEPVHAATGLPPGASCVTSPQCRSGLCVGGICQ